MKKYLFLVVIILSSVITLASETDTFTKRNEELADSSGIINQRANTYILNALGEANRKGVCEETILYEELKKYFSNHSKGILVKEILHDVNIPKREVSLSNSVYRNWSPWDGLGMGLTFIARSGITISPVINFNNVLIGADKFEHFFGQGFLYFTSNYLKEKGAVKAIKGGVFREKIFLGGNKLGNGVFSYGDLSANFNGMRFWNHVLQKHDDVLGVEHNLGPYIECENNHWVQVKTINFSNYIDSSMDESINCSKFPSKSTVEKFKKSLHEIDQECPVEPQKLQDLTLKYGSFSKWIINQNGNEVIRYFGEFKNKK